MKLYKLLTLALAILTVLAFAAITTFAMEEEAALCAAAANMSIIPIAVASLVIPSAVIAVRRSRRPKK
jgi:hypothetical protein